MAKPPKRDRPGVYGRIEDNPLLRDASDMAMDAGAAMATLIAELLALLVERGVMSTAQAVSLVHRSADAAPQNPPTMAAHDAVLDIVRERLGLQPAPTRSPPPAGTETANDP